VLATARNPAALNDLVAKYGERVRAFKHDVVEEQDGIAAARAAVETFGRLDVAVNNDWGHRASQNRPAIHSDYEPSVSAVMPALEGLCGNETIDPDRVAQVVLKAAASDKLPAHVLLSSDAAALAPASRSSPDSRRAAVARHHSLRGRQRAGTGTGASGMVTCLAGSGSKTAASASGL